MAKLTREEVEAKVKAGESLVGEDLSGLNLKKTKNLHSDRIPIYGRRLINVR